MEDWELLTRESVRQTLADYTAATDGFNMKALAGCFAADGVLEFTGGKPMTGPAAIETGLSSQMTPSAGPPSQVPTHVRHHVSSIRFGNVTPDRVEVSSYFAVYTDVGVDHWGRYRDTLVLQDGRWLFASRKIGVDGFSAGSLMKALG